MSYTAPNWRCQHAASIQFTVAAVPPIKVLHIARCGWHHHIQIPVVRRSDSAASDHTLPLGGRAAAKRLRVFGLEGPPVLATLLVQDVLRQRKLCCDDSRHGRMSFIMPGDNFDDAKATAICSPPCRTLHSKPPASEASRNNTLQCAL